MNRHEEIVNKLDEIVTLLRVVTERDNKTSKFKWSSNTIEKVVIFALGIAAAILDYVFNIGIFRALYGVSFPLL